MRSSALDILADPPPERWIVLGHHMSLALSHTSAAPLTVPVLIAESNPLLLDQLSRTFSDSIPGTTMTLCASREDALHRLSLSRYQVVVGGVDLTEAQDFSLLRWHRIYQPFAPFIITAEARERVLATRAVEYGVEDIIVEPSDQAQVEDSLRRALWLYQMRLMLFQRKQTLDKLRNWRAINSVSEKVGAIIDERILGMQETLAAYQRTIQQIETSLKYLTGATEYYEVEAKARTAEHLNALWKF